ncbi:MAG: prepilin-type N-terminal cleavage/methylation domain-containing protein [Lachnospiraceae bacterium]|nr:prepilin-type N-terminal cleavage/methylation domain-containing protein [Lachnospiraceae bacterium]
MKERKMNNKGFSLVELIIVIAIMVILVAVLAPQYLRYVEKSRVSTDTQTAVEFINTLQVVASDPDANLDTSKTYTVTSDDDTNAITVSGDLQTVITTLGLLDASTMSSSRFQSSAYADADISITLQYNATNSVWEVTTSGIDGSGAIAAASTPET